MTLLEQLQEYSATNMLPMHMPGHKRNTEFAPYLQTLGAQLDITEIPDFSNLHDPEGALADRMAEAAALWGSKRAWWLVGGSTAGLLAAIDAATKPGDKVLLARNCHKAVYNACMLCRLETRYINTHTLFGLSCSGSVLPEQVERGLAANPDTRLVVLTSPTYEGVGSDIAAISEIVHRYGAVLLVDEAHGAHFGLGCDFFPKSAVTQGADLVVQSLHKTLPSLTQTALLHLCSDRVSPDELGFRLSVYQSSSPSYLLMASIDSCIRLLQEQGERVMDRWVRNIEELLYNLQLKKLGNPLPGIRYADRSKLLITTVRTNITGPELAQRLRRDYHIESEMCTTDTVLLMTSPADSKYSNIRVIFALKEIDETLSFVEPRPYCRRPLPKAVLPMYEAVELPQELVPLEEAEGRIAGDFLWAYPPGIPLLVPGEAVDEGLVRYIREAAQKGIELTGPKGRPHEMLRVLKKG